MNTDAIFLIAGGIALAGLIIGGLLGMRIPAEFVRLMIAGLQVAQEREAAVDSDGDGDPTNDARDEMIRELLRQLEPQIENAVARAVSKSTVFITSEPKDPAALG